MSTLPCERHGLTPTPPTSWMNRVVMENALPGPSPCQREEVSRGHMVNTLFTQLEKDRVQMQAEAATLRQRGEQLRAANHEHSTQKEQTEHKLRLRQEEGGRHEQELVGLQFEVSRLRREIEPFLRRNEILADEIRFQSDREPPHNRQILDQLRQDTCDMQTEVDALKQKYQTVLAVAKAKVWHPSPPPQKQNEEGLNFQLKICESTLHISEVRLRTPTQLLSTQQVGWNQPFTFTLHTGPIHVTMLLKGEFVGEGAIDPQALLSDPHQHQVWVEITGGAVDGQLHIALFPL
eukprot:NODE_3350_length_984_cov_24.529755_g3204_i0.p1 GENE.NODE_3350_length_984_cov_24.529755_g3204_i0~~NODE_3350_length_984_cov_24.529755_g3204_i0.p1  ORF type:complete len:292 (-),score=71.07 NODE_3350_length_984_cov_24.529755_g3204_i0:74-949(-)